MQIHWHLSEVDFFSCLPAEKEEFMSLSVRRRIGRNHFIFFEGDPGDACFYLEKGYVKIFAITMVGKEPTFMVRRPGEMFGLAEVIDGKDRKCNAQAITDCVLYEIDRECFESLLSRNYRVARRVIEILGRRLRFLCEQVENLMVCDVTTRLLRLLIYLSYNVLIDSDSWDAPVTFPINLTQEQIAALTGSCQQTVSETLNKLQKDGLILVSRKEITLLSPREMLNRIYQ